METEDRDTGWLIYPATIYLLRAYPVGLVHIREASLSSYFALFYTVVLII